MKTLIIILSIFTITTTTAQSAYEKGMGKAFELWGQQKNDEAANLFERIGKAEKDNWLPFYYAAQIHIVKTFGTKNAEEVESRLTKAQDYLNQAKTFSKNNAEILIMEAMLNTAYVVYDGAKYGMTHSAKVEELYQKAKIIEPENPRAILYHAEWQMGAAKFWGKDPKAFCSEIEKAILYFDTTSSAIPFYPSWGKDQIARIQENCKS
ncbi:hypothetical protein J8L88_15315 [Aquimarina sp. MMG015]|uniref:hypothetical protein n=1 Tax=Aquimarina TaxID=290174 RepID=UPI000421190F|nr:MULTISPECIES: hypothetical protein [Aquimarina]MBQ4804232.1 hypothetical protein [Aquimarina sp. MMG015]